MNTKFDELMRDPEFEKLFAAEELIACAAQLITDLLERRGWKQVDLADRMGKTPAYVSQLMSGKTNMTIRTLAEIMHALDADVKIDFVDKKARKTLPLQTHILESSPKSSVESVSSG
uniref:HTH cro/C1-type domain-containing protein n=1 Tax=mine drainage metagenome TaxID=410659 RepID=E6PZY9_9ZZZZ